MDEQRMAGEREVSNDNLARAREWVRCEITLTHENQPLCSVHGWDTRGCVTAFRETLVAVVRTKGESDAQRARHYLLKNGFEIIAIHTYDHLYAHASDVPHLYAHAADIPEVPS